MPIAVASSRSIAQAEPSLEIPDPSPTPDSMRSADVASPPRSTPLPLHPARLRIDGLAQVVADGLRIRSLPEVSPSSERLEPLLDRGTAVFVIAGPVSGSGYDWYFVTPVEDRADEFRYRVGVVPIGWVAAKARDGTQWLTGAMVDCPDPGAFYEDLSDLEHLGPLMALACYGDREILFRGTPGGSGFIDGYGPEVYSPDWLIRPEKFHFWTSPMYWVGQNETEPFETAFSPNLATNGLPDFETSSDWDIVGHFDDPAAVTCRIDDPDHPGDVPLNRLAVILMCRTTFVATHVFPFFGIDPG
jgi:hypothetical protein